MFSTAKKFIFKIKQIILDNTFFNYSGGGGFLTKKLDMLGCTFELFLAADLALLATTALVSGGGFTGDEVILSLGGDFT